MEKGYSFKKKRKKKKKMNEAMRRLARESNVGSSDQPRQVKKMSKVTKWHFPVE